MLCLQCAADGDAHKCTVIYRHARDLYGLIHARFITTSKGQGMMVRVCEAAWESTCSCLVPGVYTCRLRVTQTGLREWQCFLISCLSTADLLVVLCAHALTLLLQLVKFDSHEFGVCPRHFCHGAPMLPIGFNGDLGHSTVKAFCSRCQDVYDVPKPARVPAAGAYSSDAEFNVDDLLDSRSSSSSSSSVSEEEAVRGHGRRRGRPSEHIGDVDGAYFGPTFAHAALMSKPHLILPKTSDGYVPRVFGFRVHGQRGRPPLRAPSSSHADAAHRRNAYLPGSEGVPCGCCASVVGTRGGSTCGCTREATAAAGSGAGVASRSHRSSSNSSGGGGGGGGGASATGAQVEREPLPTPRARPLTTSYPEGKRPVEDDFCSDSADEAGPHMPKRRRV